MGRPVDEMAGSLTKSQIMQIKFALFFRQGEEMDCFYQFKSAEILGTSAVFWTIRSVATCSFEVGAGKGRNLRLAVTKGVEY